MVSDESWSKRGLSAVIFRNHDIFEIFYFNMISNSDFYLILKYFRELFKRWMCNSAYLFYSKYITHNLSNAISNLKIYLQINVCSLIYYAHVSLKRNIFRMNLMNLNYKCNQGAIYVCHIYKILYTQHMNIKDEKSKKRWKNHFF